VAFLTDLGYQSWQIEQYLAALRGSYELKTTVHVLWNDRSHRATLPGVVVDGQVDVKRWRLDATQPYTSPDPKTKVQADQEVGCSRTIRGLTIYDPSYAISFDAGSPTEGAVYLDRSIQVVQSISCPFGWFNVPVFTGPVTGFRRNATFVDIDAESNEHFGLGSAWTPFTVSGSTIGAIIRLLEETGECENYWDIPTTGDKNLPKPVTIGVDTRKWDKIFRLAASLGKYAFYDAAGIYRQLVDSGTVQAVFDAGDQGLLLEDPFREHSTDRFRNAWRVETADKNSKAIIGKAIVPSTHPLSPQKIGRRGKPLYLAGNENLPDLRTKAKAEERGEKMLRYAAADLQLPISSRLVPHLEPIGVARVQTSEYSADVPIEEFSLPLTGGREMSVGLTRRIANPNRTSISRGV